MNDVIDKVVYPILSNNVWWALRRKVRQSPPRTIDVDYLVNVLGQAEKSAKNILPVLRRLGLVTDTNAPTDLLHSWRDDDHYADACQTILESTYPLRMRDAVGFDNPAIDQATKWIARDAKKSLGAARQAATLYLLLCAKDPNGGNGDAAPRKRAAVTSGGVQRAPKVSGARSASVAPEASAPLTVSPPTVSVAVPSGPTLHVDVQIHISPDSSAEQIDTIFASMARHFSNRPS